MPCRRPKWWNVAEKWWTSYGVLSVDPFPIEKLHQFKRNWILAHKKKRGPKWNFKKSHFGDRNDRIWLKNDDSPGESFPLTYFKSKICTNLPKTEFWRKKENDYRIENFEKKYHFGGRNDGIWLKNEEPPTKSCSFTCLQIKSCINLCEFVFRREIKRVPKENFMKKCHFRGRNDGI